MKIAFNPSTVAALTTPPNNKDITFDLRGRNIFARGVKFCGTDTNTWRDIKINNVSIGSNILDLRNGSNTILTNTNGVVTINSTWRPVVDNLTSDSTTSSLSAKQGKVLKSLIDGKSNSGHTHDDRYLKLTGGTMNGNARIGHGSGNLYIGNSGNDGWLAVQDICSQDSIGDGKWSIRVDGTASFQRIKFPSNRLIAQVSSGSNSPLKGIKLPYLEKNGIGIFSRVGNSTDEGGIVLSEDTCVIYNSFDTGWGLSVRDTDINQTDISGDNTIAFGIRQDYRAYSLGGFEKSGSNNSYVLLGGGDHKLISDFATSNHTHSDYVTSLSTNGNYLTWTKNGNTSNITVPYAGKTDWLIPQGFFSTQEQVDAFFDTVNHSLKVAYIGNQAFPEFSDGLVLAASVPKSYCHQIHMDDNQPVIHHRARSANGDSWSKWSKLLDSSNYSSYAIPVSASCNKNWSYSGQSGQPTWLWGTNDGTNCYVWNPSNFSVNYANSAGNADTLDGYHASSLVKFYLSPMTNDAPADSAKSWFVNTMPSASGAIVYNVPGVEKTIIAGKSSAYGHMLQLNYKDTYLRILRYDNGSWKSTDWEKISAGYADSAGSVAWDNVTGKPSFAPLSHTHSWVSITDKLVAGNEFNIVNAGFNAEIWFNYLPINDRSKTASIHTYIMGNGAKGMASVTASGFVKDGSSSSYVLLGDGGHQTISSLSVNYANSAGYANGIANKGLLDSQEKIDNFITANRFEYATFKTTESNNVGFASNDGMILSIPWDSTSYGAQMAFDDTLQGTVKVRGKNTSWGNWYTLLHSGNYNNYVPTKTGIGASGTWGINISGNAATATSAGNADTVDGYHANSFLIDRGGNYSGLIYDLSCKSIFSGNNLSDAPITGWVSGIVLGSNWNSSHYQHYLVESGSRWYATRVYSSGKMTNWNTFAYLTDIPNPTDYYWANVKISASSSTTTSPTVSNLTATSSIKMSNILLEHTDEINNSADGDLYLNYRSSGNVSLCYGGGNVGIETTSPSYKLDVNGQMIASGFHHRSANSDNYMLLAGGGYMIHKTGTTEYSTAIQFGNYVWITLQMYDATSGRQVVPNNIAKPTKNIYVVNIQTGNYNYSRNGVYRIAPDGNLYYVNGSDGQRLYTTICYVAS